MLTVFLSGLYLFLFILSWYVILIFIFRVIRVIALKTGKIDANKWTTPIVGLAVAYILMALIIGI